MDETDAVNKISAVVVYNNIDYIDFRGTSISAPLAEVREPKLDNNVITLKYGRSKYLNLNDVNESYDYGRKRITNLETPHVHGDAINLANLRNQTVNYFDLKYPSARDKRIIDVSKPVEDNDASTKKYVDKAVKNEIAKIRYGTILSFDGVSVTK